MKFKVGDRVYYEAFYGKEAWFKGTGVINSLYRDGSYEVIPDVPHSWRQYNDMSRLCVEPDKGEVLVPDFISKSPLYKALS